LKDIPGIENKWSIITYSEEYLLL